LKKWPEIFQNYTSDRVVMKSKGNHKVKFLTAKEGKVLLDQQRAVICK
jgi:hypothetical protein